MMNEPTPIQKPLLHSTPNLRDAGGHVTQDGWRVRTGVLFRSEQLSHVSDAELPALAQLGLKTIFDLRTFDERAAQIDRVPEGAQYVVADVLADAQGAAPAQLLQLLDDPQKANAMLGGGKAAQLFIKGYSDIVILPSALRAYASMFTHLTEPGSLPALYHCTTGKDRTGWASAALLTLCGVSEDDVMQDYLRSNDYILSEYQPMIDKYTGQGVDRDILLAILGVKREYLETSYKVMRDMFGNIEGYFETGLGIGSERQAVLRAIMVAP